MAYPPTKKKKKNKKKKKKRPNVKVTKASTLVPESPSTSTLSSSNSADSSIQASKGDSDSLRLDLSDPGTCHSEPESVPIALRVIDEPEAEEDMSTDLRVGFKERHRKRLHEAIHMVPPPTKRACPEGAREEPRRQVLPMPMPPLDTVGPSSTLVVEKEVDPTLGGVSGGVALVEEGLDQKDTPASAPPPSWDEMMEMLKHMSCFTDAEPPFTKMSDLFPFTKRISMNLGGDPPIFVSTRLPFGTPESTTSRIQQLRDCMVQETAKVVTSSMLPPFRIMHTSLMALTLFLLFLLVGGWHPQHGASTHTTFKSEFFLLALLLPKFLNHFSFSSYSTQEFE